MTDDHKTLAVAYGPEASTPTLHEAVERVVEQWPQQIALTTAEVSYTYAEVWRAARNWSGLLSEHGVVEGDVVVITAKRSPAVVAALLGVLIRGAVYSIVDPGWPVVRRRVLIERLQPRLGLGHDPDEIDLVGLPLDDLDHVSDCAPAPGQVTANDAACIFWTSGSTGVPKAVVATHRANSRLFGASSPVPVGPGRALPALEAVAWDGFALELWSQLLAGGRLILHAGDYFMPGDASAVVSAGATDIFLTAGLFDICVVEDLECLDRPAVGADEVAVAGVSMREGTDSRADDVSVYVPSMQQESPCPWSQHLSSSRCGSSSPRRSALMIDRSSILSILWGATVAGSQTGSSSTASSPPSSTAAGTIVSRRARLLGPHHPPPPPGQGRAWRHQGGTAHGSGRLRPDARPGPSGPLGGWVDHQIPPGRRRVRPFAGRLRQAGHETLGGHRRLRIAAARSFNALTLS